MNCSYVVLASDSAVTSDPYLDSPPTFSLLECGIHEVFIPMTTIHSEQGYT